MKVPALGLFRSPLPVTIEDLRSDLRHVKELFPFERGPFGISIPLADPEQLDSKFSKHYNNHPAAGVLKPADGAQCPAFRAVFDLMDAPKASFRLIRRPPYSAYELHDDRDRGEGVCRFQVPLYSGSQALLCMSDQQTIDEGRSAPDEFTVGAFAQRFPNHRIEPLEEGWLYAFNVDCIHTLYNGEPTHRVTLIMDVVMNKASRAWCGAHMTVVPDGR